MSISQCIILWIIGTPLYILLDYLWIGMLANKFYMTALRPWLNIVNGIPQFNIPAALLTWIILVLGIILFPFSKTVTVYEGVIWGAVFGFIVYAVYDLTNFSTIKDWPMMFMFIDILWGAIACSVITVSLFFLKKFLP